MQNFREVNNESYYVISGWMINELGLKGSELQIYAIIHGFSRDGQGTFYGSVKYIAEFTGLSEKTVIRGLKSLVETGYIEKEERVGYPNIYKAVQFYHHGQNVLGGGTKCPTYHGQNVLGGGTKCPSGWDKMSDNIYNNNPNIINLNKKSKSKKAVADTPTLSDLEERFSHDVSVSVLEWLEYKEQRKEQYNPMGLKKMLTQLENNIDIYGESAVIGIIDESMANGWKGIIYDRLKGGENETNRRDHPKEVREFCGIRPL